MRSGNSLINEAPLVADRTAQPGRLVASSSSSMPCAATAPIGVGTPLRNHSNATAIMVPANGPLR